MSNRLATLAVLAILLTVGPKAFPQTSAFTHQGRLMEDGQAANGVYDFSFQLFDAAADGNTASTAIGVAVQAVEDGFFTVELGFGAGVFTGRRLWLQIDAKAQGATEWESLQPRQPLTAAPYALHALSVEAGGISDGAVTANKLARDSVTSLAIADGSITAEDIAVGSLQSGLFDLTTFEGTFWKVAGNKGSLPGTFSLGTADNQLFQLVANAQRALRIEGRGQWGRI